MPEVNVEMHGFEERDGVLPSPPVTIAEETKVRLSLVIASIALGATPEEVTRYLTDGFPENVTDLFKRPLEQEEMAAHVDVVLSTLQTPALAAA